MQNRRAILFLALAIGLGLVATLAARSYLASQSTGPQTVETVSVVVARTDITVGKALSDLQVDTISWPKDHLPPGYKLSADQVRTRVLRRPVSAGEPILESALLPVGAGAGLSSVIDTKKRAVSVKVNPVVGVAGFVTPGTHVDVMVTMRRLGQKPALPESKIVLQNIPVLAIDQRLENAKDGEPELVSVVTLEVDPKQAEKLIFSSHEGKLQLALRNPEDDDLTEHPGVSVVDILGGPSKKRRSQSKCLNSASVKVLKGAKQSNKSFCLHRDRTASREADSAS